MDSQTIPQGWAPIVDKDVFSRLVGPVLEREDGEAGRYALSIADKHLNRQGIAHGGLLLTLVDKALALTVLAATGQPPRATVQLSHSFLAPVRPGDLVEARCELARKTRSLAFVTGTLNVGETVAGTVSAVFKY
jgi:uncharacterized protein (TIGR00369 family)